VKIGVIDGGLNEGTFMQLVSLAGESTFTLQADEKDFGIDIIRDEATSDTGQVGNITWVTNDTNTNATNFGRIRVDADTVTDGAESSTFEMSAYDAGTSRIFLQYVGGTGIRILETTTEQLGFYGSTGSNKQTVSGSRGGNAALQGLLAALANLGIITDSTT
jgi:hypothetical protein